jgi:ribonuclease P protein component
MDSGCAAARAAGDRCCATAAPAAGAVSACSGEHDSGGLPPGSIGVRRYALDATRRLRRRAEFEHLMREGTRRSLSGYTFYMERRRDGPPRLGILVSRRHAALATDRNRIKRCIREAFRLEQASLAGLDVLVRPPYGAQGSAAMIGRLRTLFRGLAP